MDFEYFYRGVFYNVINGDLVAITLWFYEGIEALNDWGNGTYINAKNNR